MGDRALRFGVGPFEMRDLVADWKKWSPAERAAALALLALVSALLPLGIVISTHSGV